MRKAIVAICVALMAVSFSGIARAAFTDLGAGSRPVGLGGAFVAVADDVNTVFYNAAGVSLLKKKEITAMYAPLYVGLTEGSVADMFFGAGASFGKFGVGLSYLGRSASAKAGEIEAGYSESSVGLAAAVDVGSMVLKMPISIGVGLKMLMVGYKENEYTKIDPLFAEKTSASNFGVDVGLLAKPIKLISVGLALKNLNMPSVAIADTEDKVPLAVDAGAAITLGGIGPIQDLCLAGNFVYSMATVGAMKGGGGLEFWVAKRLLGIRAGFAGGTDGYADLNAGLSISAGPVRLDYALVFPMGTVEGTSGSHRVALVVGF
jgi:hypothetical protein